MKGQYKTYDAFEADFMLLFSNVEVRTHGTRTPCTRTPATRTPCTRTPATRTLDTSCKRCRLHELCSDA